MNNIFSDNVLCQQGLENYWQRERMLLSLWCWPQFVMIHEMCLTCSTQPQIQKDGINQTSLMVALKKRTLELLQSCTKLSIYFYSYLLYNFLHWWREVFSNWKNISCPPLVIPGACLNIKTSSYQYMNSHYKDKTVSWPSYHYNGNPHICKDHLYIETGPKIWTCASQVPIHQHTRTFFQMYSSKSHWWQDSIGSGDNGLTTNGRQVIPCTVSI